jgi:hypothetical protein
MIATVAIIFAFALFIFVILYGAFKVGQPPRDEK